MSAHLAKKRAVDCFLDFLTNSSAIVIVFLGELSAALAASPNASADQAIHAYLELRPESNLANILDKAQQQKKFALVADDILESYLEAKTYNCEPARTFLKQVFVQFILDATVDRCSKAEWINEWIVYLLEDGEPELMNAIDVGVKNSASSAANDAGNQSLAQEDSEPAHVDNDSARSTAKHERTVSKAHEAMDEAIQEAKRLTQLIAEDEAKKLHDQTTTSIANLSDAVSEDTTHDIATPTSSQSEKMEGSGSSSPRESSMGTSQPAPVEQPPDCPETPKSTFTDFDQLGPILAPATVRASQDQNSRDKIPLTLLDAKISIFDDSMPGERTKIRSKPTVDYLIQIEPASTQHPGWMIGRKYVDFETLHEVLRRISVISGGVGFTEAHATLPSWKVHTKATLRAELETYLNDAVHFQSLAESEGMKRFLEKDDGLHRSPTSSSKVGFGWPSPAAFESMGKGMIDVLAKAPKEVAGGGKALLGGVTGVLGGVSGLGPKSRNSFVSSMIQSEKQFSRNSLSNSSNSLDLSSGRKSQDSVRSSQSGRVIDPRPELGSQGGRAIDPQTEPAPIPTRGSSLAGNVAESKSSASSSRKSSLHDNDLPAESSTKPSLYSAPAVVSAPVIEEAIQLPPPPSLIPDDYDSPQPHLSPRESTSVEPLSQSKPLAQPAPVGSTSLTAENIGTQSPAISHNDDVAEKQSARITQPMTEQEARVAVELLFAFITELYTLSSAWNIRRTLLNAAKTFLLRPGNPQLENIRVLLQETVIEANTSDEGIGGYLTKLRENTVPTEAELKTWPPPPSESEKVKLREKARRLLIQRGMPQALTSVMGAAASGEALEKVFDCLQIEHVARGLMFGMLLQAMRVITQ